MHTVTVPQPLPTPWLVVPPPLQRTVGPLGDNIVQAPSWSDACQYTVSSQPRWGGTSASLGEPKAQGGTIIGLESCRLSRKLCRLGSSDFWPGFWAPSLATSPHCSSGADFS